MTDKHMDELIDRALRDEQKLPEGLSRRLEQRIDALAGERSPAPAPRSLRRRLGWLAGATAAAAVLAAVLVFRSGRPMTDTFTDPAQAAEAVEQALVLLSVNYNAGLDRMSQATAQMEEANALLFKTFQTEQP